MRSGTKPILAALAILVGCGERRGADAPQLVPLTEAEVGRMLTESVTVEDGLLVVRDPILGEFESYVLPLDAPWAVRCGLSGLRVAFGPTATGNESDLSAGGEVSLSYIPMDEQTCRSLAVPLAKRLQAITGRTP